MFSIAAESRSLLFVGLGMLIGLGCCNSGIDSAPWRG